MTRFLTRSGQIVIDFGVLSIALWFAFFLRFDGHPPFLMFKRLIFVWPWVVGLQYLVLVLFGVHRFSWRLIGLLEVTRIGIVLALSSLLLFAVRILTGYLVSYSGYFQYALIPIGVLLIDFTLAFVGISGIRALRRVIVEHSRARKRAPQAKNVTPTLLIGAGQAGLLVAKELSSRREIGIQPVGFLDDDLRKVGRLVHGLPVLGTTEKLSEIAAEHGVREVLIAIAHARGADIRRIGALCRASQLQAKIIPTVHEIVGGSVNVSQIRELAIEDLLRRDPVELDETLIGESLGGQTVVVTGAGGSIGSELCSQICRFSPKRLIMVERAENALFEAHQRLVHEFPEVLLEPCVADVADAVRIRSIFEQHTPGTVFHAAAHKHVPMMESNPGEAIKNNVVGTQLLADVAHDVGVGAFVMVSTDKAVNPTSIMGASKRIAEMYVQALASKSQTRFVTVRFGNVLGSAGSVIPIFKKQIAAGGPVCVTHPDMKRYFMTIPEACQLVLQAGSMGAGGEIFILDMGEPVRIVDLAKDLISLSGLEPHVDIDIVFSGARPGEKLYEELSVDGENANKTRHPKIFVGKRSPSDLPSIASAISALARTAEDDHGFIRDAIQRLVPEYACPDIVSAKPPERPMLPTANVRPLSTPVLSATPVQ